MRHVLHDMFADLRVVAEQKWAAYPRFAPPEQFAPFMLTPGMFYNNAWENAGELTASPCVSCVWFLLTDACFGCLQCLSLACLACLYQCCMLSVGAIVAQILPDPDGVEAHEPYKRPCACIAASAMEMSAIAGRNSALLARQHLLAPGSALVWHEPGRGLCLNPLAAAAGAAAAAA